MASTYTPLATYTVPSATASYTFTSIPSTYTDLILIAVGTQSTTSDLWIQFNGDTASNYDKQLLYGTGSAVGAASYTNATQIGVAYQQGNQATTIINVMNYKNTTTFKSVLARGSDSSLNVNTNAGTWRSTSAINSIKVFPAAANLNSGFTLTLYGISAA